MRRNTEIKRNAGDDMDDLPDCTGMRGALHSSWRMNRRGHPQFKHAPCRSGGVIFDENWTDRDLGIMKCPGCGALLRLMSWPVRPTPPDTRQ